MRRYTAVLTLVLWCALLAWRTHALVPVYHSELTLWEYAVTQAPLKPRPWINYGTALLAANQIDHAKRAWRIAADVSQQPWVPQWDRNAAMTIAVHNLDELELAFQQ